jgi:hypothetical protein
VEKFSRLLNQLLCLDLTSLCHSLVQQINEQRLEQIVTNHKTNCQIDNNKKSKSEQHHTIPDVFRNTEELPVRFYQMLCHFLKILQQPYKSI